MKKNVAIAGPSRPTFQLQIDYLLLALRIGTGLVLLYASSSAFNRPLGFVSWILGHAIDGAPVSLLLGATLPAILLATAACLLTGFILEGALMTSAILLCTPSVMDIFRRWKGLEPNPALVGSALQGDYATIFSLWQIPMLLFAGASIVLLVRAIGANRREGPFWWGV